ncbi:TonB-dependent receptor [Fulvivirgaceae bacterium PWU4]|uniref:TonB-dependent receptor n=1 Tax=Chryseosolibacter histidini TaxID=2782349 RepID=A0AAP2GP43_9BACT|nr:TonB-dependent receptor [Chryseosolibacter histidini]MBT1698708.1 TonB-dependent receptor [Chryseosolibacter histidini]
MINTYKHGLARSLGNRRDLVTAFVLHACLLMLFLPAKASVHQAPSVIELSLRDVPLRTALKEIERQTDYRFVVNESQIDKVKKPVVLDIRSGNIEDVLSQLLRGTGILYKIRKKQITLIPPADSTTEVSPLSTGGGTSSLVAQYDVRTLIPPVFIPEILVKGNVKDENGEPIAGVNVLVKGSTIGTATDANGDFSINVPGTESVLVFSFIGYVSQEVLVGNQTSISVQLVQDAKTLSEVVVVGYGTQEKKDVTGAVSAVSGADIENLPSGGAQQALQGRAAGVNVVRNGGAPGNAGSIRIRGLGTVNNADPLIVIDGVPAGTMNDVNPNDIQSIDVLKDASASAIYGTRAANGVVLITTKRGKFDDKLKFTVNAYTGISNRIKTLGMLDAPTLTTLKKESFTNDVPDGSTIPPIWQDPQYSTQKTNWQDEVLEQGTTDNIDVSVRGGGQYSSFAISGGRYSERGIIGKSYYKRYTFRLNSDHRIGNKLKIGQNLQFTNTNDNAPNTLSAQDGLLWSAIRFHPGLPIRNQYGSFSSSLPGFGDINNPLYSIDTQDQNTSRNRLLGSVTGEYEIIKGLKAKANLALDGTLKSERYFYVKVDSQYRQTNYNQLTLKDDKYWAFLQEYFLSYNKEFTNHSIGIVAGYTSQTFNDIFSQQVGRDFPSEDPSLRYMSQAGTIVNLGADNGGRSYDALQSVFGRVNYAFKDRYLVTGTYRADGSSRFSPGKQWGYFPAFSLGWRVSEESFFKDNITFISSLKLTGGWGQLGNQNVNSLQYLALIRNGGTYNNYAFGSSQPQNQVKGSAQGRIPNVNIGWETAEMTNVGLDAGLLENRILLTAAYFIKDTKKMLLSPPSLGTLGKASIPDQNVGELRNKGLELEVAYRKMTGDFTYSLSGNATFIRNTVTRLLTPGSFLASQTYGRTDQEITRSYEGHPYGTFYGWVADGLYQNQAQIDSDPGIANDPRKADQIHPGDVRFRDLTGDGIIDDKDRTILGSPQPNITYGLNASVAYKGFDVNLFFLGVGGVDIYNADRMQGMNAAYPFNLYNEVNGRWHGDGTSNNIPRLSATDPNLNFRTSNLFVESGAFFRLKNITIGYTLPASLLNGLRLTQARLYVTGQNVFTITNYSGMNPELGYADGNRSSGQYTQVNVDYAQYPLARTFTVGATLSF